MNLPGISREQMAKVDQTMIEEFGLNPDALIENVGLLVALEARKMLAGSVVGKKIIILVGEGANGIDGIAAARRLSCWNAQVTILLARSREAMDQLGQRQLDSAELTGVKIFEPGAFIPPGELIIDGLIGYNLIGRVRGESAKLIESASKIKAPILAIDLPTGLDANTGKADQPVIRADATLALGYPKFGLMKPFAQNLVGKLLIGDTSIPPLVWQKIGLPAPDFSQDIIVELR